MDRVKAQATQLAQQAQETAREGRARLDQAQANKRADILLRNLGALIYAEQTGRGTAQSQDQVARLVGEISAHEAENGINLELQPTGWPGPGGSGPEAPGPGAPGPGAPGPGGQDSSTPGGPAGPGSTPYADPPAPGADTTFPPSGTSTTFPEPGGSTTFPPSGGPAFPEPGSSAFPEPGPDATFPEPGPDTTFPDADRNTAFPPEA